MIVRDGWPFILVPLILAVVFLLVAVRWNSLLLLVLACVLSVLTLLVTYFFRDPPRTPPSDPLALVSPADGKVVAIEPVAHHPHIGGPGTRISVFMSVLDVHVNRVPATGTVEYVNHNPGRFVAAFVDKSSEINEQTEIGLITPDGHRLVFKQIAGLIARRIVCRLAPGDSVTRGDRFGLIRFGSRADLIVPVGVDVQVAAGDHATGGVTILAHWPRVERESQATDGTVENNVEL